MPTKQSRIKIYEKKINEITFDVDYKLFFSFWYFDGWMTHEYEIIYLAACVLCVCVCG